MAENKKKENELVHTDERRDQAEAGPAAAPAVAEGHSVTTRDDRTDLGVPMVAGSPDEPVGPEDALGPGPKRGDYRDRLGAGYQPHAGSEPQAPNARERGDAEGAKGGVDTVG